MILHYQTTDGREVRLWGTDENKDSLFIVLKRKDVQPVLSASNLNAGNY